MTDTDDIYRVVFAGNLTGEFSLERTKSRFAKVFRLAPPKVERIFDGREVILKTKMSEEKAMEFAVKLAEIGCETYIETIPTDDEIEEKRKTIRRIRFRRPPRPGAIVPDRRLLASRRASDLISLSKLGTFPGHTVGPNGNGEA